MAKKKMSVITKRYKRNYKTLRMAGYSSTEARECRSCSDKDIKSLVKSRYFKKRRKIKKKRFKRI